MKSVSKSKLLSRFNALNLVEKKIITYLAVFKHAIYKSNFLSFLKEIAEKGKNSDTDFRDIPLFNKTINKLLKKLIDEGFIRYKVDYYSFGSTLIYTESTLAYSAIREHIKNNKISEIYNNIINNAQYELREFNFSTATIRKLSTISGLINCLACTHFLKSQSSNNYDKFEYEFNTKKISNHFSEWESFVQDSPDTSWIEQLLDTQQTTILCDISKDSVVTFTDYDNLFHYFKNRDIINSPTFLVHGMHVIVENCILKGDFNDAQKFIDLSKSPECVGLQATLLFLKGDLVQAKEYFELGLKQLRKLYRKRSLFFFSIAEVFYILHLIITDTKEAIQEASTFINKRNRYYSFYPPIYRVIRYIIEYKLEGNITPKYLINELSSTPLVKFFKLLTISWLNVKVSSTYINNELLKVKNMATNAGFMWILHEAIQIGISHGIKPTNDELFLTKKIRESDYQPLIKLITPKEQWEMLLDALTYSVIEKENEVAKKNKRIVWIFKSFEHYNKSYSYDLEPKIQTLLRNGKWSQGKKINLNTYDFSSQDFSNYFTEQDKKIANVIKNRPYNHWSSIDVKLIEASIGHPRIFHEFDRSGKNIEITSREPVISFSRKKNTYKIAIEPECKDFNIRIILETDYKVFVYKFDETQLKIANLIDTNNTFPLEAKTKLSEFIGKISKQTLVHVDATEFSQYSNIKTVETDTKVYIMLALKDDILDVRVCFKPFGRKYVGYTPGKGLEDVYTEIEGTRVHARRNLKLETKLVKQVLSKACFLNEIIDYDFEARLHSIENILELLIEIKNIDNLVVEWLSEKRKTVSSISSKSLNLKIKSKNDWFEIQGDVAVDEKTVLDLTNLLKMRTNSNSRFIELNNGNYVSITKKLKEKLNELNAFTNISKQVLRFNQVAVPTLEKTLSSFEQITFDSKWNKSIKKLDKADKIKFEIPNTFLAELRTYQVKAFNWLCKMNYLGMGVCLADDMGLGKTIEALAFMLTQASKGPILVVAPTSVCMNWVDEVYRFAPTLKPIFFAQSDRKNTIKNLAPFDLIICSYGIMVNEFTLLETVNWQIMILDESQAIKNLNTSRSKFAKKLNAKFKMVMTGTPIENHLGELWSQFHFINPGLLGSIETFNKKFANPIQNNNDKGMQKQLKNLVQPFILRRTKNQVLLDLPRKTEINLRVDLSKEERELYESIRMNAIEKLTGSEAKAGTQHLMILAEIMKLRRACCNPSLVLPEKKIQSSKLELLGNLLNSLLKNKHKALVFSQFVDHLSIVRNFLKKKDISYQYLDGSTTTKKRAKAIKEFQAGIGDVFLISLKAGGIGLNLTAADYVIHLDPWWNPAVEDQASDRAHRIGQNRPVTIYRLITSNTIEEKIVKLHKRKRDLASGLLEGNDVAGKISTKELFNLLRNRNID